MGACRAAILILGFACSLHAAAQEFVRIGNRLFPGQFLHIERGPIQSGAIQPAWWSAQWRVEPLGDTGFVRLRNRWKAQWLQVARGSPDWVIEPVAGTGYVRLRGRNGEYLHLERGALQTGSVHADAPTSHWLMSNRWPPEVLKPEISKPEVPKPAAAEKKASPPPPPAPDRWHGPGR